jgi:hypothetical protein
LTSFYKNERITRQDVCDLSYWVQDVSSNQSANPPTSPARIVYIFFNGMRRPGMGAICHYLFEDAGED